MWRWAKAYFEMFPEKDSSVSETRASPSLILVLFESHYTVVIIDNSDGTLSQVFFQEL